MKSLNDFINEGRTFQAKRKYKDYDSVHVGTNAPIRTAILGFVNEKGCCTESELKEFIKVKNEGTILNYKKGDKVGRTSTAWIKSNERFFKKSTNESGEVTYKLSYLGKKVISQGTLTEGKKISEKDAKKRLEQIRKSLRKEEPSYGEIAELEALAEFIDDDDIELRQAAGLPE